MNRRIIIGALAGLLSLAGAGLASAQDTWRPGDPEHVWRFSRAPDWDPAATEGHCRLRIFVDDRATVNLRGDQIVVRTRTGQRSYDQGSHCNQPLPFRPVDNFRVTSETGRGRIVDVRSPQRGNNFTGSVAIEDPAPGGETYTIDVAWNNPGAAPRVTAADPYPFFDETRACQDRVRREFLVRNTEDAYLEFGGLPAREDVGPGRERITGEAWARNRIESRPLRYECTVNERTNRVIAANYELRGGRWNSVLR